MGGFNETQHRRNPDGTFADMGNTRLKAACGTANARPDFSGIDLRERNFSFHDLSAADLHDADLRAWPSLRECLTARPFLRALPTCLRSSPRGWT